MLMSSCMEAYEHEFRYPQRAERLGPSGARSRNGFWCMCWELNSRLLEEQYVLFKAEP